MRSAEAQAVFTALDEFRAAWSALSESPIGALDSFDLFEVANQLEIHRRRQPALEHVLLAQVQSESTTVEFGAKSWAVVLSEQLGISRRDASRRLGDAAALGPRRTVTGESLEPELPATASAQARGEIGADHVATIREFMAHLPADVDAGTRAAAETQLAQLAGRFGPESTRAMAQQLMTYLDPDGTLDDENVHARKRGITLGRQEHDGMSRLTGWIDPGLRAQWDAIVAKLAAPGYCNPEDPTPCVAGTPSQAQIDGDTRTGAQRLHDAVTTVFRDMMASGKLGRYNGLPVTIVATTTLADLTTATGRAHTGGGSYLPIPTLLREAAAGNPRCYLAVFDNAREVRLFYGRSRRTASSGQRLLLHATDRGCTKPGCAAPPNRCQVHHAVKDWQHGGTTDIDELTLACGCDNRLVNDTPTGWTTRKRTRDNRTEWIPPPHLDRGQARINYHHHPEEVLRADADLGGGERGDDAAEGGGSEDGPG